MPRGSGGRSRPSRRGRRGSGTPCGPPAAALADFLDESVFVGDAGIEVSPTPEDVAGFNAYIESYKAGLPIEEAAGR